MKRNQISAIANIRDFYKTHIADVATIKETIAEKIANCNLVADYQLGRDVGGFDIVTVDFTDNFGDCRSVKMNYICDDFKFNQIGFDKRRFSGEKSRKHQIGAKSAWAIPHENGFLLVSYNTLICYADLEKNIIYFDIFAYKHSNTTIRHISAFLTKMHDLGMHNSRKAFSDFE